MRISDWSSDVCSSDLIRPNGGPVVDQRRTRRMQQDDIDYYRLRERLRQELLAADNAADAACRLGATVLGTESDEAINGGADQPTTTPSPTANYTRKGR